MDEWKVRWVGGWWMNGSIGEFVFRVYICIYCWLEMDA